MGVSIASSAWLDLSILHLNCSSMHVLVGNIMDLCGILLRISQGAMENYVEIHNVPNENMHWGAVQEQYGEPQPCTRSCWNTHAKIFWWEATLDLNVHAPRCTFSSGRWHVWSCSTVSLQSGHAAHFFCGCKWSHQLGANFQFVWCTLLTTNKISSKWQPMIVLWASPTEFRQATREHGRWCRPQSWLRWALQFDTSECFQKLCATPESCPKGWCWVGCIWFCIPFSTILHAGSRSEHAISLEVPNILVNKSFENFVEGTTT